MAEKHILKQHIGYWLNRLRNCVHKRFEERLLEYGVSVPSWCILVSIYDGSAQSVNELSTDIEVDKATISRMVEKLVLSGFLTHESGKDKRSGIILLTPRGLELMPQLIRTAEENEQEYFGHLKSEEKQAFQDAIYTILFHTTSIELDSWGYHIIYKEKTMQNVKSILSESKKNRWPYPKTFEALRAAGVKSYHVNFSDTYEATYTGTFGTFKEEDLQGYHPLKTAETFSGEGVKAAIIHHIQQHTSFIDFLGDAASQGVSHYKVDMQQRTVTYFNPDESKFHQEHVPNWIEE